MSARAPRVQQRVRAERIGRNLTLSPRSEALLTALSGRTGIPRGRIVDLALSNLACCEACQGRRTVDSDLGPDTATCGACAGAGLVPGSE